MMRKVVARLRHRLGLVSETEAAELRAEQEFLIAGFALLGEYLGIEELAFTAPAPAPAPARPGLHLVSAS